jgi:heme oxygenase
MSTRFLLRDTTSAIHEQIHRLAVFKLLEKGELTRPLYAALLLRFYGFFRPMEGRLRKAWPLLEPGAPIWRPRSPLLLMDLEALGIGQSEADCAPAASDLPEVRSAAATLGCLYVLQGSALGGRVLARQLDVLFAADSISGRLFFAGDREWNALAWKSCCDALETYSTCPNRQTEIIEAAMKTFESFASWFDRFGVEPHRT